jgi:hypothetical protein
VKFSYRNSFGTWSSVIIGSVVTSEFFLVFGLHKTPTRLTRCVPRARNTSSRRGWSGLDCNYLECAIVAVSLKVKNVYNTKVGPARDFQLLTKEFFVHRLFLPAFLHVRFGNLQVNYLFRIMIFAAPMIQLKSSMVTWRGYVDAIPWINHAQISIEISMEFPNATSHRTHTVISFKNASIIYLSIKVWAINNVTQKTRPQFYIFDR